MVYLSRFAACISSFSSLPTLRCTGLLTHFLLASPPLLKCAERAGSAPLALRLWEHMRHHAIPADVAIVAMRLLGTLVKAKRHDKVL